MVQQTVPHPLATPESSVIQLPEKHSILVGPQKRQRASTHQPLPPRPSKKRTARLCNRVNNYNRCDPAILSALGIGSVKEFLSQPRKDRQKVYSAILTHPDPLHVKDLTLWDDRGFLWADDPTLPRGTRLLDERQTESPQLTQEAREYFYSQNLFVISLGMPWFGYSDDLEGFTISHWLQRLHVVCYPFPGEKPLREFSDTRLCIDRALDRLIGCDRLDYVVLELRGAQQCDVRVFESHLCWREDMLRQLDDRLQQGVLVVRECAWDPWGRCLRSQSIRLPWWDPEKVARMQEVEDGWRRSSQVQLSQPASWETMTAEPTGEGSVHVCEDCDGQL